MFAFILIVALLGTWTHETYVRLKYMSGKIDEVHDEIVEILQERHKGLSTVERVFEKSPNADEIDPALLDDIHETKVLINRAKKGINRDRFLAAQEIYEEIFGAISEELALISNSGKKYAKKLEFIDEKLQDKLIRYNKLVEKFNKNVEVFPTSVIAAVLKFNQKDSYTPEEKKAELESVENNESVFDGDFEEDYDDE